MKVCIVSRVDFREPVETAQSLGWMLADAGHEVVYEDAIASELGYSGVSLSDPLFSADLIVVLGGDGSVLRAVRMRIWSGIMQVRCCPVFPCRCRLSRVCVFRLSATENRWVLR